METNQDTSISASPGDLIRLDVDTNNPQADLEFSMTITSQQNHNHDVNIPETGGETADIAIDVNSSDSNAGNTEQLSVSGETDQEDVEIKTTEQEQTSKN